VGQRVEALAGHKGQRQEIHGRRRPQPAVQHDAHLLELQHVARLVRVAAQAVLQLKITHFYNKTPLNKNFIFVPASFWAGEKAMRLQNREGRLARLLARNPPRRFGSSRFYKLRNYIKTVSKQGLHVFLSRFCFLFTSESFTLLPLRALWCCVLIGRGACSGHQSQAGISSR